MVCGEDGGVEVTNRRDVSALAPDDDLVDDPPDAFQGDAQPVPSEDHLPVLLIDPPIGTL